VAIVSERIRFESGLIAQRRTFRNVKYFVIILFLLLGALHQDLWNWDKGNLILGFLPTGLAYHAAYSIVVAIFWGFVVLFAWPTRIEAWAEEGREGDDA